MNFNRLDFLNHGVPLINGHRQLFRQPKKQRLICQVRLIEKPNRKPPWLLSKHPIAKERIANGHSYCEIGEPAGEKLPVKLSVLRRRCSAKFGFRCLHVISPFRVKGYSNEYARTDRAQ
jgi:hypothetical protein